MAGSFSDGFFISSTSLNFHHCRVIQTQNLSAQINHVRCYVHVVRWDGLTRYQFSNVNLNKIWR